jgi:hypothetical protein
MSAFVYDDGGRAAAGRKGTAGDCVVRAIAIAAQLPYAQVYDDLFASIRDHYGPPTIGPARVRMTAHRDGSVTRRTMRRRVINSRSPRNGVPKPVWFAYLRSLGWTWTPCMAIGAGCTVHLRADDLPAGRIIAQCSGHLVAVIDGVIHDTYDPSRNGRRCVYGYWSNP